MIIKEYMGGSFTLYDIWSYICSCELNIIQEAITSLIISKHT